MNKAFLEAVATLIGGVVGAGIFAIPYVVAKAGFLTGLVDIIAIASVIILVYLYLGEIILRTKGLHQLTGYAGFYLGKWGKRLMAFSMIFGIYGALLAYLIGEGEALSAIFGISNPLLFSFIFFVAAAVLLYFGLKALETLELCVIPVIITIIILMGVIGFPHINTANLTGFNPSYIFIPYGVILFAFAATAAIPEMREELAKNEKHLKKAIIIGISVPMVVYLLFAFITIGITGSATTEIATIGLGNMLGQKMVLLGNIFAAFAMLTAFLIFGLALKEMYNYDYKLHKSTSWILACLVPAILFALVRKFAGFTAVIEITGAVGIGITGVLIILMAWRAKKLGNRKPEYSMTQSKILGIILMAVFILGMIYELLRIFGILAF